jgi:hypothetical protein
MYDSPHTGDPTADRRDANFGHILIDYGGQWLTARLVAVGRGHELYSKQAQREVLEAGYPRADEPPAAKEHDADSLLSWLVEVPPDEPGGPPVSGPLYPPTHAVLFAPLGRLPPRESYWAAQVLFLALGWVAGLAISGISRGRIWWPVATMFAMIFPGFGPALHLAQNSALSAAIVLVGWWLVARGWDAAGGVVWGLLAYKPVWAVAFVIVPLLTRRWRMLAGMLVGGLAFVLATLPVVGVRVWWDWYRIGQAAADVYRVDVNWIFLSRDLVGIPRRWLLNFDLPQSERDRLAATVAGLMLWAGVFVGTAAVALLRPRAVRPAGGYGAAFVTLGAWASCFHFIYYDSLLALLPVTLLLTEPRRFIRPIILAATPAPPELAAYYDPRPLAGLPPPTAVPAGPRTTAVLNSFVLTAVALLLFVEQTLPNLNARATVSVGMIATGRSVPNTFTFSTGQHGTPWDTFVLLGLWAYCGVRVLMGTDPADQ